MKAINNSKWLPLLATQFLGVLNDNLLKGAISFISVAWVSQEDIPTVLALASALLVVPFILFSPWAGKLSMKYRKTEIVSMAKLAEVFIMVIAFAGFAMENLYVSMSALLLMGIQSAMYSPSKYGLIKDIGHGHEVSLGVGLMEMITFVCVLLGLVVAGLVAEVDRFQVLILGILFMLIAVAGWWSATKITADEDPVHSGGFSRRIDPVSFSISSIQLVRQYRRLGLGILGLMTFWFVGCLFQLNLLVHLPAQYGLGSGATGLLIAVLAASVGLGCWVSGLLNKERIEWGWVPLAALGMGGCLLVLAFAHLPLWLFSTLAGIMAFLSGLFKVPLNSWIQQRVQGRNLGQVLAFQNIAVYSAVLVASVLFGILAGPDSVSLVFALAGGVMILAGLFTLSLTPDYVLRLLVVAIGRLFFRIRVTGSQYIPRHGGALIVANHSSLADFFFLVMTVPRQLRFVMLKDVYNARGLQWLFRKLHMIPINARGGENDLAEFNALCKEQLRQGHIVCIFAEGTVTRTGQILEFKKGVEHIIAGEDVPVIPLFFGNVQGAPFTFRVGQTRAELPRLRFIRQPIFAEVGHPMFAPVSAFGIRQIITELESRSYAKAIGQDETVGKLLIRSLRDHDFEIHCGHQKRTARKQLVQALCLAELIEDRAGEHEAIGVLLPKSLDAQAVHIALHRMGLSVMPCNPKWTPEQQMSAFRQSGIEVLLTTKDLHYTRFVPVAKKIIYIEDLLGEMELMVRLGSSLESLALSGNAIHPHKQVDKLSCALIVAQPGVDHAMDVYRFTHEHLLVKNRSIRQVISRKHDEGVVSNLQWFNAYGYTIELIIYLAMGYDISISQADKPEQFAAEVATLKPKIVLADHKELRALQPSSMQFVERIFTDSEPVSAALREELELRGISLHQSCGLNQLAGIFAVNTPNFEGTDIAGKMMKQRATKWGTVGRPLPGTSVRVVDPANTSRVLNPGEVGRIIIRSASSAITHLYEYSQHGARQCEEWILTPFWGTIDKEGFLVMHGNQAFAK